MVDKIVEVAEGAHSPLGPSAADRWLNCPGSVLATMGMPDTPSSYALEGTAAHTVSEWVRERGVRAKEFLGTIVRVTRGEKHWDIPCDAAMVDSVQAFVDKVGEYEGDELCEVRVSYTPWVKDGFGTLDSGKMLPKICRITDFKHGQGVRKDAKMNPQLMLYALGLHHEFGWLFDFETFSLAISQPRLDHYDEWEISRADLLAWAADVVAPIAKRALEPGAPFKAGEHCQFCRIKATCRVRAEALALAVVGDFEDLDAAKVDSATAGLPLLSNDEIARALGAAPQLKKWLSALEQYAANEVRAGRTVGTYKLVAGRSTRQWAKPEVEVVAALVAAGVDEAAVWSEPKLLSPTQMEGVVPDKRLFKPASAKKAAGALEALVHKPGGAPTLVPGSDSRPTIASEVLKDFENLEDGE